MFILDKPYVSDFLLNSIREFRIPVLSKAFTRSLHNNHAVPFLDEPGFTAAFRSDRLPLLYTNSENAIGWISRNLHFTPLPAQIDMFKDKVKFRRLLQTLDPGFFFREVHEDQLDSVDPGKLPFPFIIKPAVGFFSLGVYKVEKAADWPAIRAKIRTESAAIREVYPLEVLDNSRYLLEQCIDGREFAFDAYFNSDGQPVVLSLLEHLFSSPTDVSDRVYISSAAIFHEFLGLVTEFLRQLGGLFPLRNFPLHGEVRIDGQGKLRPVEINPLRFGGWCTTADMTWFAYGFNPYAAISRNEAPDWPQLIRGKEHKIYSNIVLTNSTDMEVARIKSFDYEKLKNRFENPLELRKADFKKFLMFGFLFAETSVHNYREIEWILRDDLREFMTME